MIYFLGVLGVWLAIAVFFHELQRILGWSNEPDFWTAVKNEYRAIRSGGRVVDLETYRRKKG